MADTCIVCLGDLRTSIAEDPPPEPAAAVPAEDAGKDSAKKSIGSMAKSIDVDDEAIAHLLPCKHDLHHACLKPWVERANSCPICRTTFNMVEVSRTLGGEVLDSYAVRDKVQEAEIDPSMIVEDELFSIESWEPCLVCGNHDDGHGAMYCDGCAGTVHVFCAGFDDAPDVWYCESCLADLESNNHLPGTQPATRRARGHATVNGTANRAPPRRRRNDALWARVWQEVSRRLDLDLDFPFDEEPVADQRTEEQRREFQRWQRRFEVANRQGATNRLRGVAHARLHPGLTAQPDPESQEELRAWNAFDKARETEEAPSTVRRRKRRASGSPASPHEGDQNLEQPQLKRPRLRRPPPSASEQAEASNAIGSRRNHEEPTFLSSLLREVETKPASAASPATSDQANGQYSPRNSSPVRSPASSECGTPQAAVTPPHRPLSPPLSSSIMPATSPTFSPFSPTATKFDAYQPDALEHRGRRRLRLRLRHDSDHLDDEVEPRDRQSSASPVGTLSYSAKQEIQRMVKLALGSRYRDKEVSKEQYTDINRDVSRKMYDLVGNASALADQEEREKWQDVANDEVQKAITALSGSPISEE